MLELPLILGETIGQQKIGASVLPNVRGLVGCHRPRCAYVPGPTVLDLEWTDPLFVAGHWTPQMIQPPAARPLLITEPGERSVAFTTEEVMASDPDWIIISPCGLDAEAHAKPPKPFAQGPLGHCGPSKKVV